MKVSIIIPVYNVENYLVRCLDSVTAQTCQDIECILVDDCGNDHSVQIAEDYIQTYQGPIVFKFLHHTKNRGLAAARNTGIDAATGDYLFFLDSDDTIVDDCIESLLALFGKYPDIDFAQGNILAEDGTISSYGFQREMPEYTADAAVIYRIMLSEITTVAWNRLIRRDFVLTHKLYFPEGYFTEDMYWGYFIAKHVKAVSFTHKGLYTYYINEGSMMTSPKKSTRMKWFTSRLWTSGVYLADIRKGNANKYQRQYLAVNLLSCLVELANIMSVAQWLRFWSRVCRMSLSIIHKTTWHRLLLFICLMPPVCFLASKDKIRWRIQQRIIPFV